MLKILFMGTPEFAAAHLRALLAAGYPVVGVVTQPDKPVGRGGKLQPTPVKEVALAHGLPVFQPRRVRRPEVLEQLRPLGAEVTVVVAFGQILSKEALEISPLGSINVHGSLLPRWRGAAPIQRAIMAGDAVTGITTMWMDEGMDTGDICLTDSTPIAPDDTGSDLHDRLMKTGSGLLIETLRQLEGGTAPRIPQPAEGVTYAPKIEPADEVIDWTRPAAELVNQIRALNSWPGAYTEGPRGRLKVWRAEVLEGTGESAPPGTVTELVKRKGFRVACGEGSLLVLEVQPPGKGRMEAHAFVNGGGVTLRTRLGAATD